ncbi:MAG: hypothetical protein SRB2_03332 [Desulfobacteraceae bacterium Eth-SRB2]|nr:MAG: hypothetical protein SRB2_03332 [Desulfobacteraceae bacterium Eth-SRB2]
MGFQYIANRANMQSRHASKLYQKCNIAIIAGIGVLISSLNRNHGWGGMDSWFKADINQRHKKIIEMSIILYIVV